MLTNSNRWDAENINQVGGPKQRLGGGSKARKALGDAGAKGGDGARDDTSSHCIAAPAATSLLVIDTVTGRDLCSRAAFLCAALHCFCIS